MDLDRRRRLNIPIHNDDEHVFVSGYCTCGQAERKPRAWHRQARAGRTAGRSNLDRVEGNPDR